MSNYDAERALAIYKTFSRQTNEVVEFLSVARQHEHATRLEIPKLKHAPTSLTSSLEEYLNDPDFEINRRQYLAQQEAKRTGKPISNGNRAPVNQSKSTNVASDASSSKFPEPKPPQAVVTRQEPRGPAPDLIDFFASIEQDPQPMVAQTQQQPSTYHSVPANQYQQQGFVPQPNFQGAHNQQLQQQQQANGSFGASNPFSQMMAQHQMQSQQPQLQQPQQMIQPQQQTQPDFTGTGFGGYQQQPTAQGPAQLQQAFSPQLSNIPQNQNATFSPQQSPFATGPQNQSTNPFRQSMLPQSLSNPSPPFSGTPLTSPLQRQSTNPFARMASQQSGQPQNTPFDSLTQIQNTQSLPPSATGSSFFTPLQSPQQSMLPQQQPMQSPQPVQQLQPQRTGTNPFARSTPQSQSQTPVTFPLMPNPTGSTNPFRQSAFINQQTGQGWQAQQGTMGGLEQLPTIPVFPRPGQPPPPQQQQQAWP